jgi:TRAP-type C4-dicarboxylate transport system permease small subunit
MAPATNGASGNIVRLLPKIVVGALVLLAITVMLIGVFLRYVMVPITDWMDVDPINFFWVEEVGELLLAWLTLTGAAIGIVERSHFTLTILTQHLPPAAQRAVHILNHVLIAAFGGVLAWLALQVARLNVDLASPALEISVAWLYVAAIVGGLLMVPYALVAASRPAGIGHTPADVRE